MRWNGALKTSVGKVVSGDVKDVAIFDTKKTKKNGKEKRDNGRK
ncbi:hypothetical protein G1C97_0978 [Bifidobacterium sp. DSM 109959]|uniref:Uncharacterized protein n=1 Tax=Bifidobacterium olomucense TaxID=2675324 RepID=A0A7Y0HXI0_9BIFI|nr:hypothetical protein [Bifidobacterium sp. DSM 109959]